MIEDNSNLESLSLVKDLYLKENKDIQRHTNTLLVSGAVSKEDFTKSIVFTPNVLR